MTPILKWLGFLMERLFEAGALDVVFSPGYMKKNRPAVLVHVMGKPQHKDQLMDILFSESTTLGVRFHYTQRRILERCSAEIDSPWGTMKVKRFSGLTGLSICCLSSRNADELPKKRTSLKRHLFLDNGRGKKIQVTGRKREEQVNRYCYLLTGRRSTWRDRKHQVFGVFPE